MFNFLLGKKVARQVYFGGGNDATVTEREESGLKRMLRERKEAAQERANARRDHERQAREMRDEMHGMASHDEKPASWFDRLVGKANAVVNAYHQDITGPEAKHPKARHYEGIGHTRTTDKTVEYWDVENKQRKTPIFVDKGKMVSVSPPPTSKSVEQALRHASERSNKPLRVQGSDVFIQQTVMAALGLGVADRLVGIPEKLMEAGREQYMKANEKTAAVESAYSVQGTTKVQVTVSTQPEATQAWVIKDRPAPTNSIQAGTRDAAENLAARLTAVRAGPEAVALHDKKNAELTQRLGERKDLVKDGVATLAAARDTAMIQATGLADPRLRLAAQLEAHEQHYADQERVYKDVLGKAETHVERFDLQEKANEAAAKRQLAAEARENWIARGSPSDNQNARLAREAAGFGQAENQIMHNANERHQQRDLAEARDWSSSHNAPIAARDDSPLVRDDIQSAYQAEKADMIKPEHQINREQEKGIDLDFG